MSATFSEDAKDLAKMLTMDAQQAEGQGDDLSYVKDIYPGLIEQIGKVLVHLGQMKLT